jgi:hypothetical protein
MARTNIGNQVAAAMRRGQRVQDEIRAITLRALTEAKFDRAALRRATREVADAIREAAKAQGEGAREAAKQAVAGMDHALADAGHAFRLSLEEAAVSGAVFARAAAGALAAIADSIDRRTAAPKKPRRRARPRR